MELALNNITLIIIVIGSIIGSVKTVLYLNEPKSICVKVMDVVLGIFCGIAIAEHFATNLNMWLSGLVALVAGSVGAIALNSIIELFPKVFKDILKKYVSKVLE